MALVEFSPNTVVSSDDVNSNFTNLSNHSRWVTLKWSFPSTLQVETNLDYLALPDDATWERADLICDTAPTGDSVIVDIERSVDNGGTWVTIFTNQANRPSIAAGSRTGNTITVDVSSATAQTHYFRAKVEQIGSSVAGKDLSVMLRGKYDLD